MLLMRMRGEDVFVYRDSSAALLLDLWRRIKAVMDVLDAIIRDGISLARSVELTSQCDEILSAVPVNPITLEDFQVAGSGGLGVFRRFVEDLHCSLSDFTRRVVVHRWELFVGGGIGNVRILLFVFTCGSGLTWCPLLHFSSVSLT